MPREKLFAVLLGGRAPKCNTELHDVVFVTGATIEDTYEQLMDKWFGTPRGLHIDSWMELDVADGHGIELVREKPEPGKRLYFVNLGGYQDGVFAEIHANGFVAAENLAEAKKRGRDRLAPMIPGRAHTDDLYEVDSCLALEGLNGFYIKLTPADAPETMRPHNGYHILPKAMVEDFIARHPSLQDVAYRQPYEQAL